MTFRMTKTVVACAAGLSLAACVAPQPPETATPVSVEAGVDTSPPAAPPTSPSPSPSAVAAVADPIVTDTFRGGTFNWGNGGGIKYRYTAIERDGEVFICGAYARRGSANLGRLSREAMRQASITLDGETVLSNLTYFPTVSSANWDSNLIGVETNCQTTGVAAGSAPLSQFRIKFRDGSYRIRL